MTKTRACRGMLAVTVLMGATTAEALIVMLTTHDDRTLLLNSAIAFVGVTIACTTWIGALVTAHLRPLAVAWALGVKAAQRQAVEQRTHLHVVADEG